MAGSDTDRPLSPQDLLQAFRGIGAAACPLFRRRWPDPDARAALGRGAGRDITIVLDDLMERTIIEGLAPTGAVRLVSEEAGVVDLGGGPWTVIADPLDGSTNAKGQVPSCAMSLAGGLGPTMADLSVAYVVDLLLGDEFWALRGGGAFRNGSPLTTAPRWDSGCLAVEIRTDKLELLAAGVQGELRSVFRRIRAPGALALDLCHVASGAYLGSLDSHPGGSRVLDVAAGQLIVREAGGAFGCFEGDALGTIPLEVDCRRRFVAAVDEATMALLRRGWPQGL